MRIAIASDHAGFDQKRALIPFLEELGHEVTDMGPNNGDRVDYPDYAEMVGRAVASGEADRGVLICGTGIGMAMAADKIAGVRAANVITPEFADLARRHNDCNVITLSGRFVSLEENKRILKVFLYAEFEGGRHAMRVAKIMGLDLTGKREAASAPQTASIGERLAENLNAVIEAKLGPADASQN